MDLVSRERLEALEKQLAATQRIAHIGGWQWEIARDRVTWSDELYRIYGFQPGEIPIDFPTYLSLVHPDDRERIRATVAQTLEAKEPMFFLERIVRPDGSIRTLRSWGEVLPGPDGRTARMIGVCQDVTESEDTERELDRSLSLVRATLESTADGLLVVDAQGRVESFNQKFLELWRIPEILAASNDDDQLLGFVLDQLVDPDGCLAKLKDIYAHPQRDSFDVLEFKDGRIFERYSQPQRVAGEAVGRVWSFRDVTALRTSEQRYRSLFERNLAGVYRTALDGRILDCNDAFARLLGYDTPAELKGCRATALYFDSADRDAFVASITEHGSLSSVEAKLRRRDGQPVWILENVTLVKIPGSDSPVIEGTIVDLTERKHLEDQFCQVQKMEAIGRLAGGIAHDFNNLMTTVIGFSDLLLAQVEPGGQLERDVSEIRRAGERAADLTRQLLAFSRQQVLEPRIVDLNGVVRDTERMLLHLIGEDIELVTHLAPGLGSVRADPGQIEQVLVNLAVNARDAMPEGGRLTLETTEVEVSQPPAPLALPVPAGAYVRLSVEDTGVGMSEETRSHIFEPFFTTKDKGKGTGLGLATVYGIVKQSGGFITVTSEIGRGSRFDILLARTGAAPRVETPASGTRSGTGS